MNRSDEAAQPTPTAEPAPDAAAAPSTDAGPSTDPDPSADPSPSADPGPKPKRRRGEWLFQIFGPPTVSGAVQGHSPEARAAWKRRVEQERAARRRKP